MEFLGPAVKRDFGNHIRSLKSDIFKAVVLMRTSSNEDQKTQFTYTIF